MPNVNSNASFWKDGDVITADKLNSSSVLIIEGEKNGPKTYLSANGPTFEELWAHKDNCYLILKTPTNNAFLFSPVMRIDTANQTFAFNVSDVTVLLGSDGEFYTNSN